MTAAPRPDTPFCCPTCRSGLLPHGGGASERIVCEGGHQFPILGGIPRFVGGEEYSGSFGVQWNRWSTTQVDSANGTSIFRRRFQRYVGDPVDLSGQRVLDAGCGAGAFLDVVAPHAREVVGFDLSSAVEAAAANMRGHAHVDVAQADIYAPPVESASFDLVYCIGVLQHTPDPARAFASIARLVRPGGRLAVWVYERARWEPFKPRHLVRPHTVRLSPDRAMRFVERYAPPALTVRHRLKRLPGGRLWSKLIPVADIHDYADEPASQLSSEQVREWTVMDTHDMLVTRYDHPQTPEAIRHWFAKQGFENVERRAAESIAMVGRRTS